MGSASLHPRLYSLAPSARLKEKNQIIDLCVASPTPLCFLVASSVMIELSTARSIPYRLWLTSHAAWIPVASKNVGKKQTLKGFRKNRVQISQVVDGDVFNSKKRFLCNSFRVDRFFVSRSQRDAPLTLGCGARPFQGRCFMIVQTETKAKVFSRCQMCPVVSSIHPQIRVRSRCFF